MDERARLALKIFKLQDFKNLEVFFTFDQDFKLIMMKKYSALIFVFCSLFIFVKASVPTSDNFTFENVLKETNAKFIGKKIAKYAYAEVVYQNSYTVKTWVSGKYVSQEVADAISKMQHQSGALDIMGEDGWELVTSFTRNFNSGYEYYYYFRKPL